MKVFNLFKKRHHKSQREAVMSGLREHYDNVELTLDPQQADFSMSWGHKRTEGLANLVLEHGFVNSYHTNHAHEQSKAYGAIRNAFMSISWNGICGRTKWKVSGADSKRTQMHGVSLCPWRAQEKSVLICLQMLRDASLERLRPPGKYNKWLRSIVKQANQNYDTVYYKPHPKQPLGSIKGAVQIQGDIQQVLDEVDCTIQYSSTCAVDSIIRGVPAVTFSDMSVAHEMCSHTVGEATIRPDRSDWIDNLMYRQWTREEIAQGIWWDYYKGYLTDH